MASCAFKTPTLARAGLPRVAKPVLIKSQRGALNVTKAEGDSPKLRLSEDGDLAPLLASVLFVAATQNVLDVTPSFTKYVLAVATAALPAANIVLRKVNYNWASSALAPLALAAAALDIMTLMPAALVAFGTDACTKLAECFSFEGAYYVFLATLGAAVYYEYGAVWFCAAYVATYGYKVLNGFQAEKKVLVSSGALAACGSYAIFDYFANSNMATAATVSLCIIIAQLAWSIFGIGQRFADDLSSK